MNDDNPKTIPNLGNVGGYVALEIKGDYFYPEFSNGDFVLHPPLNPRKFRLLNVHGKKCVVRLADGREMLRIVYVQAGGKLATLTAHGVPDMIDQTIIAASPIVLRILTSSLPVDTDAEALEYAA